MEICSNQGTGIREQGTGNRDGALWLKCGVSLDERHLRPGRTRHFISDGKGQREFPAFESLVVTTYPSDSGCYLMHVCASGETADTWHENLEDALYQAEYEFEVRPDEWTEIDEAF